MVAADVAAHALDTARLTVAAYKGMSALHVLAYLWVGPVCLFLGYTPCESEGLC